MLLYSVKENLSEEKLKQNKKTFKDSKLKIVEGVQVFNRKLKNATRLQEICRNTPMPRCHFNKLLCNRAF